MNHKQYCVPALIMKQVRFWKCIEILERAEAQWRIIYRSVRKILRERGAGESACVSTFIEAAIWYRDHEITYQWAVRGIAGKLTAVIIKNFVENMWGISREKLLAWLVSYRQICLKHNASIELCEAGRRRRNTQIMASVRKEASMHRSYMRVECNGESA